jgi:hypothetical protein
MLVMPVMPSEAVPQHERVLEQPHLDFIEYFVKTVKRYSVFIPRFRHTAVPRFGGRKARNTKVQLLIVLLPKGINMPCPDVRGMLFSRGGWTQGFIPS